MSEIVPTPEPEQTFAAYVRAENAKDRAAGDPEVPPADVSPAVTSAAPAPETPDEPTPAEPAPEPEKPEPPDVAAAERNPDGTFKPKASKKVTNTGEWARNQRLTAELRETQAELQRLRAGAPAPTPAAAPAVLDPADPEPSLDAFLNEPDPYAALAIAAGKWAVREATRVRAQEAQQAAQHAKTAEVRTKIETFAATHPDYYEKVAAVDDIHFPSAVVTAIAEDDLGPAVAYFLAEHPEEARRIAALTPLTGVKEIGKLSSRLTPAPSGSGTLPVSTSKAKPLIKPVSGSPGAPDAKPPDDLPFGSRYIREMNAKERRDREALRG